MTAKPEPSVAGEPIDALLRALGHFRVRTTGSTVSIDATIPVAVALPFTRALMRVEAELLKADADGLVEPCAAPRTADERRAAALTELVARITPTRGA